MLLNYYIHNLVRRFNRVVLIGRLTKEPELYYTKQGVAYARICVAVNRGFRNSLGEQQVDFINCVVWRRSAENVTEYCTKGSLVGITGRIHTSNYDDEQGKRVYRTEVLIENITFLERRRESASQKY
ncbi:single-stranded DNA-binding protein [Bacillus mycoides]|uniref:single-stranded DNA-binding protein n=1 Tax=Bacillus mycoides TaxID=1405 RepID=UPI000278CA5C|nr:single-stranded DNA-binding protein [Bacillus mycoides]EJQ61852.1 single-strand binding protein [Bacillus mycoides]EJQ63195.1 single-strand binding protein [Bacillus mycoides]EJV68968.1 single-strand binding protein [Bacillus mycoides]MDR4304389.1 single-stranded DNA-binding protein [Bacillus mycoides]